MAVFAMIMITTARVAADPADGYCDYVEGTAAARSAMLSAPELIGSIGYGRDPGFADPAAPVGAGTRVVAGVRYKLSAILEGSSVRARARADCARHRAVDGLDIGTARAALEARARVLDQALPEAEKILARVLEDIRQRLSTGQELLATRLRVDELRALASATRGQLAALPPGRGDSRGALAKYYAADEAVEAAEARLRTLESIDVSVRAGYDRFIDRSDDAPYFAVLSVGFNVGALFQSSANDRAAAGRRRMARERNVFQREVEVERVRAEETTALMADLEMQMVALDRVGGEDSRRYRHTVWFDYIKLSAELAYLTAHVASLDSAAAR